MVFRVSKEILFLFVCPFEGGEVMIVIESLWWAHVFLAFKEQEKRRRRRRRRRRKRSWRRLERNRRRMRKWSRTERAKSWRKRERVRTVDNPNGEN